MLKSLREWLVPAVNGCEIDFAIAEWAVAGHHPAHDHASPPKLCPAGAGTELTLLMECSDFQASLRWLCETFHLAAPPSLGESERNLVGADNVFGEVVAWAKKARRIWDDLNEVDRRLVAAVKDSLVAADIAGSALPKRFPDDAQRWAWISESRSGS